MNRFVERLEIIRQRPDQLRLLAGGAAIAIVAGIAGAMIGSSGDDEPAPAATVAAGGAEAAEATPTAVAMTAQQIAANGIAVEQVKAGSLRSEIIAQATVTAPPEGRAVVTARADGAVVRINKRLGDPVGPGETLALLQSREAAAFASERNAAAARAQAARSAAAREQRLFNEKITARQDLEAAIAAQRTAEAELQRAAAAVTAAGVTSDGLHLAVRSPIGGRITKVDQQLGAYVMAGAELFEVADPRRIQIEASVPLAQARLITPGDGALIELPDGRVANAGVRSISPALDPQSRTATVVLQLQAAAAGLTQGQAVRVRMTPRGSETTGIVLPEEAVQTLEGRDVVFIRTSNGFRAQPVSVGQRSGGRVEVLSGIKPGQQVATTNVFQLKAELAKGAGEEE